MAADLRRMQENQGFSENRIDKSRFIEIIIAEKEGKSKKSRIALQAALSFALQGDYFFMDHLSASDIFESIFSRYAASITILSAIVGEYCKCTQTQRRRSPFR